MSSQTRGPLGRGAACCAAAPVETTVAAAAPMTVRRLIKSPSLRSLSIEPPRLARCRSSAQFSTHKILAHSDQIEAAAPYLPPPAGRGSRAATSILCPRPLLQEPLDLPKRLIRLNNATPGGGLHRTTPYPPH